MRASLSSRQAKFLLHEERTRPTNNVVHRGHGGSFLRALIILGCLTLECLTLECLTLECFALKFLCESFFSTQVLLERLGYQPSKLIRFEPELLLAAEINVAVADSFMKAVAEAVQAQFVNGN